MTTAPSYTSSQTPSVPPLLRSLELFTGAGGLALGTHRAGFHHTALVEWNRDACDTLRLNAEIGGEPGIEHWRVEPGDARCLDFRDFGSVDLVAGGPPCQPFSIAGKHRGTDDTRNMIPHFARAIRELVPRAFIMENVRGLLRRSFAAYFDHVRLELSFPEIERRNDEDLEDHHRRLKVAESSRSAQSLQYQVFYKLLNAADYGVAQIRHRVFVVGFRSDLEITWEFPPPTHALDALLQAQWVTEEYWDRHRLTPPKVRSAWNGLRRVQPRLLHDAPTEPWQTVRDAIGDLPEPRDDGMAEGICNHQLIPGARPYVGHTGSPLDLPAKTLKAGDHGVPGGENMIAFEDGTVRYFTVREAARLQTFPDTWRITGVWSQAMRQLGNAVPVDLAHVISRSVAEALHRRDHDRGT